MLMPLNSTPGKLVYFRFSMKTYTSVFIDCEHLSVDRFEIEMATSKTDVNGATYKTALGDVMLNTIAVFWARRVKELKQFVRVATVSFRIKIPRVKVRESKAINNGWGIEPINYG